MHSFKSPDRNRVYESGSAYIVALMALLVLTIGGLSVALLSQTEMQVGANERLAERAFYAAESGLNVATSYILTQGGRCSPISDWSGTGYRYDTDGDGVPDEFEYFWSENAAGWAVVADQRPNPSIPGSSFGDVAGVAPAIILQKSCCVWCICQENPELSEVSRFVYGMWSQGRREAYPTATGPGTGTVVAQKTLGTLLDVQPLQSSGNEICLNLPPSAALIRF
jgi:hypothetical protein